MAAPETQENPSDRAGPKGFSAQEWVLNLRRALFSTRCKGCMARSLNTTVSYSDNEIETNLLQGTKKYRRFLGRKAAARISHSPPVLIG